MDRLFDRAVADARRTFTHPSDAMLDQMAAEDHAQAKRRGEKVLEMTDAAIDSLIANQLLYSDRDDCRVVLFHALADRLYGNAAIDIPPLRRTL